MSVELIIHNNTGNPISIESGIRGSVKIFIPSIGKTNVQVRDIQFDDALIESLSRYMDQYKILVFLEGIQLTSSDVRELKHTDVNEVTGQWLESKERTTPPASLGHGRFYSGSDGHPHYRAGNGADFDLSSGGTYLEQVTHRIYVDGGRTDIYVEIGSVSRPFKTIMGAVAVSTAGDCIDVAAGMYYENVILPGNRHIDADMGTMISPATGCPLKIVESAAPFELSFIRGVSLLCNDPADWVLKIEGTDGNPFVVLLDGLYAAQAGGNGFWNKGGGLFVTDAGGVFGAPKICVRVGDAASDVGGWIQFGAFNLNTTYDGGKMFQIFKNGRVSCQGTSIMTEGSSPSGAIMAEMVGGSGGPGATLMLKDCNSDAEWGGYTRCTGLCYVHIEGAKDAPWERLKGPGFVQDEGWLDIQGLRVNSGQGATIFALGSPGKNLSLDFYDVEANVNSTDSRPFECVGNINGKLYDCQMRQRNSGSGLGVMFLGGIQNLSIVDGIYEGPGAVIDQRNGNLWLLGGVDIVPTAGGFPGSCPLAVAMGATVHRGHANFRSGTPLISGNEDILNSTFGTIGFGPAIMIAKQGAGASLPGGGQGWGRGSLFVLIPQPTGRAVVYVNLGDASMPNWVENSFETSAPPGTWANPPGDPKTVKIAIDRLAAALVARTGAVPIP